MRYEFLRLAETIERYAQGDKVYLLCNPGNWGDALIRVGTEQFLKYFGIRYEKLNLSTRLNDRLRLLRAGLGDKVLLCVGGGAWCGHYSHFSRAVEIIRRRYRFRKIIVLPSTYEKPYRLEDVVFFRRDQFESAKQMPDSTFCHDLAFFIGALESPPPEKDLAYCFRVDVETSGKHHIPASNHDLSGHGTDRSDVSGFFEYLADYRVIHTDRLHIAIGASLLAREVHVYPGKYFKNRAIFRSSLEPYFPNTTWHDVFGLP